MTTPDRAEFEAALADLAGSGATPYSAQFDEALAIYDALALRVTSAEAELEHATRRGDRGKASRDNYAAAFSKAVAERDALRAERDAAVENYVALDDSISPLRAEVAALATDNERLHILARDLQGDLRGWYSHDYDEMDEPPAECGGARRTRDLLDEAERVLSERAALAPRETP